MANFLRPLFLALHILLALDPSAWAGRSENRMIQSERRTIEERIGLRRLANEHPHIYATLMLRLDSAIQSFAETSLEYRGRQLADLEPASSIQQYHALEHDLRRLVATEITNLLCFQDELSTAFSTPAYQRANAEALADQFINAYIKFQEAREEYLMSSGSDPDNTHHLAAMVENSDQAIKYLQKAMLLAYLSGASAHDDDSWPQKWARIFRGLGVTTGILSVGLILGPFLQLGMIDAAVGTAAFGAGTIGILEASSNALKKGVVEQIRYKKRYKKAWGHFLNRLRFYSEALVSDGGTATSLASKVTCEVHLIASRDVTVTRLRLDVGAPVSPEAKEVAVEGDTANTGVGQK